MYWAQTVQSTRTALFYGADIGDTHAKLVTAGWSPEEAHFIIRAAQVLAGGDDATSQEDTQSETRKAV